MYHVPVYRIQLVRDGTVRLEERPFIQGPEQVVSIFREYVGASDREHLVAILLDNKNRVLGVETIHIGAVNQSLISGHEVFKSALLCNAMNIILCHNHPSGDPEPSSDDVSSTRELQKAGALLKIAVLDHVIIGEDRSVSLKTRGLLD